MNKDNRKLTHQFTINHPSPVISFVCGVLFIYQSMLPIRSLHTTFYVRGVLNSLVAVVYSLQTGAWNQGRRIQRLTESIVRRGFSRCRIEIDLHRNYVGAHGCWASGLRAPGLGGLLFSRILRSQGALLEPP